MKHTLKYRYYFVLIAIVINTLAAFAQREMNYIYLFDCTGSMQTNGLWETARRALDNNISLRTSIPGSDFTVIPFGDNPYKTFSFSGAEYHDRKTDISKSFDSYISLAKYTNISDVLKSGFEKIDPNKKNEIYLFTDGMPNGDDSAKRVAEVINHWCSNHHNSRLFYVALTKDIVNPVIKQAIDACADASIVQCADGVVPVITDISTEVYTNLEELDHPIELAFSLPGEYSMTSSTTDALFDLSVVGGKASGGKLQVLVTPKENCTIEQLHQTLQGNEYEFHATIQCVDRSFTIVNPTIVIHVSDEIPSKLTIAEGVDELKTEGVEWYDAFLWSDASPDKIVVWDLIPIFQNALQDSRLTLRFQPAEGETEDFHAWYNGEHIGSGSTIMIDPGKPARFEIEFDRDATTGKRYFTLVPTVAEYLDFVNGQPADEFKGTSLRTSYNIIWNPLKTFFFWFGIALLTALVLWLAVLKRIFFPTISMSKAILTGPGTYYTSKKIKGARKVKFTSKRKSQNILSRIFTGEIRYVKADHFTSEITIVPAKGKKKVKFRTEGKSVNSWDIYPSFIFGQYDKGTITNRTTGEKTEVEFS